MEFNVPDRPAATIILSTSFHQNRSIPGRPNKLNTAEAMAAVIWPERSKQQRLLTPWSRRCEQIYHISLGEDAISNPSESNPTALLLFLCCLPVLEHTYVLKAPFYGERCNKGSNFRELKIKRHIEALIIVGLQAQAKRLLRAFSWGEELAYMEKEARHLLNHTIRRA